MRFLRLLGALARAVRGAYIIRVFVVFLHDESENKTTCVESQEFFKKFGYTKVTPLSRTATGSGCDVHSCRQEHAFLARPSRMSLVSVIGLMAQLRQQQFETREHTAN